MSFETTPTRLNNSVAGALTKRKPALIQFAGVDAQIGETVDRETETALGQGGEALMFDRPHGAHRALGEFEHQ